ncbi:MAG: aminoacyl-tRNA hydrolase [Candidatus Heritagella sp.]
MFFSRKNDPIHSQASGPVEWIIAGLGNPGRQYENTRHNTGFAAVDALADSMHMTIDRLKFKGLTAVGSLMGHRVLLLKPSTFMNLSGQSVQEAMQFYKIPAERVLLLFDDISLPCGRMRIRRKGSDGGHNGVKNILYLTGKDTFPRVKIGVGQKPDAGWDLADWVLSHYSKEESAVMQQVYEKIPQVCSLILDGRLDEAMNRFNS